MKMKPLPTVERVREVLRLDESGNLVWRIAPNRRVRAGTLAGTKNGAGYAQVSIDGRVTQAHRVVWVLAHGEWPAGWLDHINGRRDDNRAENLRLATPAQNNANAGRRSDNRTGFKGVSFDANRGKFLAYISVGGKQRNLGRFDTAEEAHAAYSAAATSRGEFARTN